MSTEVQLTTVVDRELPPVLESVGVARELVACDVPVSVRGDVALVVSELVANAVKHSSGPIGVRVEVGADRVRVSVRDGSPTPLGPSDGYGLRIVEHIACEFGVRTDPHGKTVWAEIAL